MLNPVTKRGRDERNHEPACDRRSNAVAFTQADPRICTGWAQSAVDLSRYVARPPGGASVADGLPRSLQRCTRPIAGRGIRTVRTRGSANRALSDEQPHI